MTTTIHRILGVLLGVVVLVQGKESTPQPLGLCGTRDLTTFEQKLDQRRMNALFGNSTEEYNNVVNNGEHRHRKLFVPPCEELCKQCIEIPTYFHLSGYRLEYGNESSPWVIPHPTDEFQLLRQELRNHSLTPDIGSGRFSNPEHIHQLIQQTMEVLNKRYADTPFCFRWINNADPGATEVHVQNDFAFFYAGDIHRSNGYARAAHQGDRKTLNIYLMYRICGHRIIWMESNCLTIGAATNPSYQLDGTADGVYLSYDTLAGGGLENYDTGLSLVHEVGHWLGLLHVFQSETLPDEEKSYDDSDPCDPINVIHGDYVEDTPFLPKPSVMMYKCSETFYEGDGEIIPNSCPDLPGVDPVFNYMNYVGSEACLAEGRAEFTCGQRERMMKHWLLYREHDEVCAQGEMQVNVTLKIDADYADINAELAKFSTTSNNNNEDDVIFNLNRDIDMTLFPHGMGNTTRSMNFCVPQDEYVLVVNDIGRDGFDDGFIKVTVNGEQVHRLEGDFGSFDCAKFNADGIKADTRSRAAGISASSSEFGEKYNYVVSDQDTSIFCKASDEPYLQEPIPIMRNRYMRVAISLANATQGVCINEVTQLDITIDGLVTTVFPRDDNDAVMFDSVVRECRGETCTIQFDLERLEEIYGSKNKDGIYETTCTADVQIGFGGACDDFVREGNFDCSGNPEVFSSGMGTILFSISAAARSAQFASGLLITGASLLVWILSSL